MKRDSSVAPVIGMPLTFSHLHFLKYVFSAGIVWVVNIGHALATIEA